jgi:hypothetical protein
MTSSSKNRSLIDAEDGVPPTTDVDDVGLLVRHGVGILASDAKSKASFSRGTFKVVHIRLASDASFHGNAVVVVIPVCLRRHLLPPPVIVARENPIRCDCCNRTSSEIGHNSPNNPTCANKALSPRTEMFTKLLVNATATAESSVGAVTAR